MSMTDPVADMLTRIRNAQRTNAKSVMVPSSTLKRSILDVLADEGYIAGYTEQAEGGTRRRHVGQRDSEGERGVGGLGRGSRRSPRV